MSETRIEQRFHHFLMCFFDFGVEFLFLSLSKKIDTFSKEKTHKYIVYYTKKVMIILQLLFFGFVSLRKNRDLCCIVTNHKLQVLMKIIKKLRRNWVQTPVRDRSESVQTEKCGLTFGPDRPRPVYFETIKPRPVQFSDRVTAGDRTFAISTFSSISYLLLLSDCFVWF